jgi:hypothetical protein
VTNYQSTNINRAKIYVAIRTIKQVKKSLTQERPQRDCIVQQPHRLPTNIIMATSLDQSKRPLCTAAWSDILGIVETFGQLTVDSVSKPLAVDHNIGPKLPSADECIRNLAANRKQPLPSALADPLHNRIDRLRHRMLRSYTESVSRMVSLSEFTGIHDSDEQREYSRSIEAWFNQAIQELYVASTTKPINVRRPADCICPDRLFDLLPYCRMEAVDRTVDHQIPISFSRPST